MPTRFLPRCARAIVFAAGVLVSPLGALGAQQACFPAPDEAAKYIVMKFLLDGRESARRQAHGITAISAEQLTPLTDPTDAVLCRRMDSTITRHPIAYFRAGSTIFASTARLWPDTSISIDESAVYLFLFDSAGRFMYQPGTWAPAVAPNDLHVTSSAAGPVALAWTKGASNTWRHQLHRAVGAGAFVPVGGALQRSYTSTADSTAQAGVTYRYRLEGVGPAGDSTYSNEVSVTPGIFEVARASSGFLYRDRFDRPDGAVGTDWVAESGTWSIVGNALQIPIGTNGNAVLRLTALANRKDFHIQVWNSRSLIGNFGAIYARRSGVTLYLADLGSSFEVGGKPRMHRQTGGNYALLGYGTFLSTANVMHRITFSVLGSERKLWANGLLQVSATDATPANDILGNLSLNVYGAGGAGTVRYDDLIVCSARAITIAGLPAGFKIRVGGLTSVAATTGAAVTLDLLGTELPAAQVEILDGLGAVFKTIVPADGVWGGDRYSVNGAQ